ncbi:envelope stress response membrane protein PspB [Congregibacter brevis]|uniref:Envelope stress response membrane protein PspB n=1 Tax=Congregibacter brevis TaxID=3081201 RepID=A0ABZ0I976_9GAMM|nr:envelope stress response membrane protein PspB [Congregibacter sp. IMCC45268]
MELYELLFVPTILFMVIVAPIWIVLHYRSLNRSSRSLNEEDRENVEQILVTVDRLTERIQALESILDSDHGDWRDHELQDSNTRRSS